MIRKLLTCAGALALAWQAAGGGNRAQAADPSSVDPYLIFRPTSSGFEVTRSSSKVQSIKIDSTCYGSKDLFSLSLKSSTRRVYATAYSADHCPAGAELVSGYAQCDSAQTSGSCPFTAGPPEQPGNTSNSGGLAPQNTENSVKFRYSPVSKQLSVKIDNADIDSFLVNGACYNQNPNLAQVTLILDATQSTSQPKVKLFDKSNCSGSAIDGAAACTMDGADNDCSFVASQASASQSSFRFTPSASNNTTGKLDIQPQADGKTLSIRVNEQCLEIRSNTIGATLPSMTLLGASSDSNIALYAASGCTGTPFSSGRLQCPGGSGSQVCGYNSGQGAPNPTAKNPTKPQNPLTFSCSTNPGAFPALFPLPNFTEGKNIAISDEGQSVNRLMMILFKSPVEKKRGDSTSDSDMMRNHPLTAVIKIASGENGTEELRVPAFFAGSIGSEKCRENVLYRSISAAERDECNYGNVWAVAFSPYTQGSHTITFEGDSAHKTNGESVTFNVSEISDVDSAFSTERALGRRGRFENSGQGYVRYSFDKSIMLRAGYAAPDDLFRPTDSASGKNFITGLPQADCNLYNYMLNFGQIGFNNHRIQPDAKDLSPVKAFLLNNIISYMQAQGVSVYYSLKGGNQSDYERTIAAFAANNALVWRTEKDGPKADDIRDMDPYGNLIAAESDSAADILYGKQALQQYALSADPSASTRLLAGPLGLSSATRSQSTYTKGYLAENKRNRSHLAQKAADRAKAAKRPILWMDGVFAENNGQKVRVFIIPLLRNSVGGVEWTKDPSRGGSFLPWQVLGNDVVELNASLTNRMSEALSCLASQSPTAPIAGSQCDPQSGLSSSSKDTLNNCIGLTNGTGRIDLTVDSRIPDVKTDPAMDNGVCEIKPDSLKRNDSSNPESLMSLPASCVRWKRGKCDECAGAPVEGRYNCSAVPNCDGNQTSPTTPPAGSKQSMNGLDEQSVRAMITQAGNIKQVSQDLSSRMPDGCTANLTSSCLTCTVTRGSSQCTARAGSGLQMQGGGFGFKLGQLATNCTPDPLSEQAKKLIADRNETLDIINRHQSMGREVTQEVFSEAVSRLPSSCYGEISNPCKKCTYKKGKIDCDSKQDKNSCTNFINNPGNLNGWNFRYDCDCPNTDDNKEPHNKDHKDHKDNNNVNNGGNGFSSPDCTNGKDMAPWSYAFYCAPVQIEPTGSSSSKALKCLQQSDKPDPEAACMQAGGVLAGDTKLCSCKENNQTIDPQKGGTCPSTSGSGGNNSCPADQTRTSQDSKDCVCFTDRNAGSGQPGSGQPGSGQQCAPLNDNERKCKDSGGIKFDSRGVDGKHCICENGLYVTDGIVCPIQPAQVTKETCEKSGATWNEQAKTCACADGTKITETTKNCGPVRPIDQTSCSSKNATWDAARSSCTCNDASKTIITTSDQTCGGANNDNTPSNIKTKDQCFTIKGAQWWPSSIKCTCTSDSKKLINLTDTCGGAGDPVTTTTCAMMGGSWDASNSSCRCSDGTAVTTSSATCSPNAPVNQAVCQSKSATWNATAATCTCPDGTTQLRIGTDTCTSSPNSVTANNCGGLGGSWDTVSSSCKCTDGSILNSAMAKCPGTPGASIDQATCQSKSATWNATAATCTCPDGTTQLRIGTDTCTSSPNSVTANNCGGLGGSWDMLSSSCKCTDGSILNSAMAKCPGTPGASIDQATCQSKSATWNATAATCTCPDGTTQLRIGTDTCTSSPNSVTANNCGGLGGSWDMLSSSCKCTDGSILNSAMAKCPGTPGASIDQATCQSKSATWNATAATCTCPDGTTQLRIGTDTCTSSPNSVTANNCGGLGGSWDMLSSSCKCTDGSILNSAMAKCPGTPGASIDQATCQSKSATWNATAATCTCPDGTTQLRIGTDTCTSSPNSVTANNCGGLGGSWDMLSSSCKCTDGSILNSAMAKCPGTPGASIDQATCQSKSATWNTTSSTCTCPDGVKKLTTPSDICTANPNTVTATNCGGLGGTWDSTSAVCKCTDSSLVSVATSKCPGSQPNQITQNDCGAHGATWDTTSSSCKCQDGSTISPPTLTLCPRAQMNADYCPKAGATWNNTDGTCTCPGSAKKLTMADEKCDTTCRADSIAAMQTQDGIVCRCPDGSTITVGQSCPEKNGQNGNQSLPNAVTQINCTPLGGTWDTTASSCKCIDGSVVSSTTSKCPTNTGALDQTTCVGKGATWSATDSTCTCPDATTKITTSTGICPASTITSANCTGLGGTWDTTASSCKCTDGSAISTATDKCPTATNPNPNTVTESNCSGLGGTWDTASTSCKCTDGSAISTATDKCPTATNPNPNTVTESNCSGLGGTWDTASTSCKCTDGSAISTATDKCPTATNPNSNTVTESNCSGLGGTWDTASTSCKCTDGSAISTATDKCPTATNPNSNTVTESNCSGLGGTWDTASTSCKCTDGSAISTATDKCPTATNPNPNTVTESNCSGLGGTWDTASTSCKCTDGSAISTATDKCPTATNPNPNTVTESNCSGLGGTWDTASTSCKCTDGSAISTATDKCPTATNPNPNTVTESNCSGLGGTWDTASTSCKCTDGSAISTATDKCPTATNPNPNTVTESNCSGLGGTWDTASTSCKCTDGSAISTATDKCPTATNPNPNTVTESNCSGLGGTWDTASTSCKCTDGSAISTATDKCPTATNPDQNTVTESNCSGLGGTWDTASTSCKCTDGSAISTATDKCPTATNPNPNTVTESNCSGLGGTWDTASISCKCTDGSAISTATDKCPTATNPNPNTVTESNCSGLGGTWDTASTSCKCTDGSAISTATDKCPDNSKTLNETTCTDKGATWNTTDSSCTCADGTTKLTGTADLCATTNGNGLLGEGVTCAKNEPSFNSGVCNCSNGQKANEGDKCPTGNETFLSQGVKCTSNDQSFNTTSKTCDCKTGPSAQIDEQCQDEGTNKSIPGLTTQEACEKVRAKWNSTDGTCECTNETIGVGSACS